VIIFGLSSDAARLLAQEFAQRNVNKLYQAVVRGYTEESGVIDYPLQEEKWTEPQPAVTAYRKLAQVELPHAVGRYQTARYSLLEVQPETGRMHQIRKHMKHIFHPIVGDTTHGDGKHNQLFRVQFDVRRLLLVATELQFQHPYSKEHLTIKSASEPELQMLFEKLGWVYS
jgi:tRNA pseudouridine65 synthase